MQFQVCVYSALDFRKPWLCVKCNATMECFFVSSSTQNTHSLVYSEACCWVQYRLTIGNIRKDNCSLVMKQKSKQVLIDFRYYRRDWCCDKGHCFVFVAWYPIQRRLMAKYCIVFYIVLGYVEIFLTHLYK